MKFDLNNVCTECGAPYPSHYGRCSGVPAGMKEAFAAVDRDAAERHERERKRLGEIADMQASGRARMRGKLLALGQDTKFLSFDRDMFRNVTNMSDAALDVLSLAIRD